MNQHLTLEELNELLPAFVIGILDPDEMLAVSEALEQNPELQARLESLDEMNAAMAQMEAPTIAPPTAVRSALMARVEADLPQLQESQPRLTIKTAEARQPTLSLWERLFGGNPWKLAAGVMAVLLGISAVVLLQRQQVIAEAQTQLTDLQSQNSLLQEQLNQEEAILASLTGATQTLALSPTDEAPTASGEFYRTADEVVLVARGLSPAPPAKAYYLWGVILGPNDEKIFTNLGPVALDEDGNVIAAFPLPGGETQYDVIDVSLEDQSDPPPPALEGDIVLRGLIESSDGG